MLICEFNQPLGKSIYFQRIMVICLAFTGLLVGSSSFHPAEQLLMLSFISLLLFPFLKTGKPHANFQSLAYTNAKWQLTNQDFSHPLSHCQCLINTPFFYLLKVKEESAKSRHLVIFKDQLNAESLRKMQLIWFINPSPE